jgi:hypothetical protein
VSDANTVPDAATGTPEIGTGLSGAKRQQPPGSNPAESVDTDFIDAQTDSGGIFAETPNSTGALLPGSVGGVDISEQQLADVADSGERVGDNIADSQTPRPTGPAATAGPIGGPVVEEIADAGGRAVEGAAELPGAAESTVEFAQNAPLSTDTVSNVGAFATSAARGTAEQAVNDPVNFGTDAAVGAVTGTAALRGAQRAQSAASAARTRAGNIDTDRLAIGESRGMAGPPRGANAVDDGDGLLLERTETVDDTTQTQIDEPGEDPTLDELQQAAELAEERQQSSVEFEQDSTLARKRQQERQELGLVEDERLQELENELATQRQTAADGNVEPPAGQLSRLADARRSTSAQLGAAAGALAGAPQTPGEAIGQRQPLSGGVFADAEQATQQPTDTVQTTGLTAATTQQTQPTTTATSTQTTAEQSSAVTGLLGGQQPQTTRVDDNDEPRNEREQGIVETPLDDELASFNFRDLAGADEFVTEGLD